MAATPGTSETDYFEKDGQYLSQLAGEAITLGYLVELASTANTVSIASDGSTKCIGVAIAGQRVSRTSTDNVVASGAYVNVCTRGVVNVLASGTVTRGELVQAAGTGMVKTCTLSTFTNVNSAIGIALTTATADTVKVKLLRG